MKKTTLWASVCGLILCVGIIGSLLILSAPAGTAVEIVQDGKTLYEIDLTEIREEQTLTIESANGTNTVWIRDGKICVIDADCPDQTCVKTGWLESASLPIVCLPHHLVIQFSDESGRDADGSTN